MRTVKGFSLVEVMVGVAILSVSVLGMTQLAQSMSQSTSTADFAQRQTSLMYEVNGILTHEKPCTDSLKDIVSPLAGGAEVDVAVGNVHGSSIYSGVSIDAVKLKNVEVLSPFNRLASIEINGSARGNVNGSSKFIKSTRVYYEVDASEKIIKCITASTDPAGNCAALGGVYDGTKCNFCESLGGEILPDESCKLQGSTTYAWDIGAWNPCASGAQTRDVRCIDSGTSAVVADTNCVGVKPNGSQICFSYSWKVGSWGACDGVTHSRSVVCEDVTYHNTVADSSCSSGKPLETDTCTTYSWNVGDWGACADGITMRSVACVSSTPAGVVDPSNCAAPMPPPNDVCVDPGPSLCSCEYGWDTSSCLWGWDYYTVMAAPGHSCSEYGSGGASGPCGENWYVSCN